MLNKMSMLLATAAVVLSVGAASAADYRHRDDHRGGSSMLTVGFGGIAFGYNDGYWDTGHRWHRWKNSSEYHNYRDHGANYHGWKHNRDRNQGWFGQ